ncbi:MAG TPA: hypothetical protein VK893_09890 [Pyrinomonadaceae bacterium]|nr:hypothetical protein [Pyrinomonadaceae bacterium]
MFFLTLCPTPEYEYLFDPVFGLFDFLGFFSVAAVLAIPIGMFVFWWNNFVANQPAPRSEEEVLSLDDNAPLYSTHEEPGHSTWMVALYLLTGLVTFSLGVLAYDAVHAFG